MGKRVSLTPELIWDPLFCNVSSFDQRVGIATPHGRESPAFRGSAGSHFSSIAVPLKLRGEQPKGYHPCHIEMSSLSSMTTPQCCGVWHDCCGSCYASLLFSSAEAFANHSDFEEAVCVLLDINLGDASGIELRLRLKAAGSSVPVIYMTGNDSPAVRTAALRSGCLAYLTKPFSAKSLREPLERASAA